MALDDQMEVTVLGAGIVGICCALSLRERGISVRLIDRGKPGAETSYGNAGIISPWSLIPQSMPGVWRNVPRWLLDKDGPVRFKPSILPKLLPWSLRFFRHSTEEKARAHSDAMEVLTTSCVELFRKHLAGTGHEALVKDAMYVQAFRNIDQPNLKNLEFKIRAEKGADLELIGADVLRELEPELSQEFKAAVLIKGQARAMAPGKIASVLAEKAIKNGVEFIQCQANKISPTENGRWNISTPDGTYSSEKIILCAGIWSTRLLEPLGYKLPLIAERGYHVEYAEANVPLNNSVMDVDNKIVASSMLEGVRVAGTSEFAPIDAPADPKRYASLRRLTKRLLPNAQLDQENQWMGCRPSFPDSLPVVGEMPNSKGLYGAFGHSHYGLMMAPKTGEIISDMITGRPSNHDLGAYSANRFL